MKKLQVLITQKTPHTKEIMKRKSAKTNPTGSEHGAVDRLDLRARIEIRAYHLWLADGGQHGNSLTHWRQAERELAEYPASPA
jgi:hypothetical protein